MIWICVIVLLVYVISIAFLVFGFSKIEIFNYQKTNPKTSFSIVIPFRNEAESLPELIESISNLNYPRTLFEVFFVDDASEDDFEFPILDFRFQILKNNRISNSPKKDAIQTAIEKCTTEWIITTDADCTFDKNWLCTFDAFIQENDVEIIASAVNYKPNVSFLHHFQQLDLASLQGATIGSFGLKKAFMCNGANFSYTKSLFEKLNGFEGNDSEASGDDVFMLQKAMQVRPEKVGYLKSESAIVTTKPLDNWKELWFQRVRWASKTGSYSNGFGKFLALAVFFGNAFWIIGFCFLIFDFKWELFFALLLKCIIDSILIGKTNAFLKSETKGLFFGSLSYPFFSVSVALYSVFGNYQWKGRTFRC